MQEKGKKFWMSINEKYMSQEESDEAEDDVLIKSRPVWHSEGEICKICKTS